MKCPKCHSESPADTRFCSNCGAPLHPSEEISVPHTETLQTPIKELTTGSTFAGRYQIIEELGKGGMGKVYKILDIWKNVDPGIPEVSDAKKRLAALRKL